MTPTPDGAYERMVSVAVAALHERDPERLWPLLAAALPGLCGGEALIYKLDDWSETEGTVRVSPGAAAEFRTLGEQDMALLRSGYPFAALYSAGPERVPVSARRVAGPSWPTSPTARMLRRILDTHHVLGVPLPQTSTPITGFLVFRSGTDFTDDDIRAARRAQPLLAAVEQQRQLLDHWQRRLLVAGDAPGAPHELAQECALTPRETTVLLLLADALTAAAIGRRLGISDRTVHKHVENIYRKLGTRDRVGTVLRAQQIGLVPWPGGAPAGPRPGKSGPSCR
ncbi:LuxR C-terminal-related transcriptional regulator, partial [Streptomyces sp. NPDC058964]|uniref:helix-turn-helix transcriptional regulator n=1 Tax=Streptomyces sp. NPDC058964 TaxID=3346681 RepID=UPI0036C3A8A1